MSFEDDDILEEIAQRFGVSKEEVVKSRKLAAEYDKEHQKRKQQHRLFVQQESKRKEQEKYRREHPDECFCYQDGFGEEASHRFDQGDEQVGWETRWSGPFVVDGNRSYQSELFKCRRCGKKYGWPVAAYG